MNKKEIRCAQQCYDFPVVVKVLLLYVAANVFLELHSHCRVKTLLDASGNAKTPLCTANTNVTYTRNYILDANFVSEWPK